MEDRDRALAQEKEPLYESIERAKLEYVLHSSPTFSSHQRAVEKLQDEVIKLGKETTGLKAFREGENRSFNRLLSISAIIISLVAVVISVIVAVTDCNPPPST